MKNKVLNRRDQGSWELNLRTGDSGHIVSRHLGFPGGTSVKNPPAKAGNAGDMSFIPGSGTSPGGGNGSPL